MTYDPRTIAFFADLRHPPMALDPKVVQRIHNQMFETGFPTYSSFNSTPQGAFLSNPATQPGMVSSAAFLGEAIQFREELTGMTVEEFAKRVGEVVSMSVEPRGVQVFPAMAVTLRTLINPRRFDDSRTFLREGVLGFDEELEHFARPAELFGLRMVFPPTTEEQNAFTLRIESFANDPRSTFLETQGSFSPINIAQGLEVVSNNIEATYDFLIDRALPFLGRFDVRLDS